MKTDTYTKVILTFIALFLGILVTDKMYEATIPTAGASASTARWECGNRIRVSVVEEQANAMKYSQMTVAAGGDMGLIWCGLTTQPESK